MEKIRIKSKSEYVIEVNDKGETISFDLEDISLPIKLTNVINKIKIEEQEFKKKLDELLLTEDNEADEQYKGLDVTTNFMKYTEIYNEFCNVCRGFIDSIFGLNASQKIFGNSNTPEMFNDFFEQMQPHLEKAGMNLQKTKKVLIEKYSEKRNDVI